MGPTAGEHEDRMGPRAGEHEDRIGSRAGGCYPSLAIGGAAELEGASGGQRGDERHVSGRVRRDGLAVRRQHRLAVAVVRQDEEADPRLDTRVAHHANAHVRVRRRLHRLVHEAGVTHHVGRREVADEQRVRARLDLTHLQSGGNQEAIRRQSGGN